MSWCLCRFSVWDRVGTGSVNAMMFRRLMTTRGEKLTDEDVDEMMEFVKIGEKGEFKYNGEPLIYFCKISQRNDAFISPPTSPAGRKSDVPGRKRVFTARNIPFCRPELKVLIYHLQIHQLSLLDFWH